MPAPTQPRSLQRTWWWLLWLVMTAACVLVEVARASDDPADMSPILRTSLDYAFDTPMFVPLCLLFPLAWWVRSGLLMHRTDLLRRFTTFCAHAFDGMPPQYELLSVRISSIWRDWLVAICLGGLSLLTSWQVGLAFGDLPPAYHDEYSYLFQAKTLAAGHFSYRSHPSEAELFDQMHVLNRGHFASRYYPGTGAWLVPWLNLGHPVWGQWLAGALTATLMYWTGRQLGGFGAGLLAGLLTALSPGLALFSNLLLAHHPTLLGLSLFTGSFVRWMGERRTIWLLPAGIGLAFAMLCRPISAAGFALPFGIWFLSWFLRTTEVSPALRFRAILLLGLPLAAGWIVMGVYNADVTGAWWKSPHQVYNDFYTPRHAYGFNNVTRGAAKQGGLPLPEVTRNYDSWAENLTPELAAKNVGHRSIASWRWTLGIVPILWICLAAAGLWSGQHPGWLLVAGSIVTLHLIHVPYWFDGIMHWHYVFESSLSWILLVAGSVGLLIHAWQAADRPWMIPWLGTFLTVAVASNFVEFQPYWIPRLSTGIAEVRYPRRIYGQFRHQLKQNVTDLPALVLVLPDPADRHMDFVTNDPSLSAPILIGRITAKDSRPDRLARIKRAFPDRALYLFDAKTRQLTRIGL